MIFCDPLEPKQPHLVQSEEGYKHGQKLRSRDTRKPGFVSKLSWNCGGSWKLQSIRRWCLDRINSEIRWEKAGITIPKPHLVLHSVKLNFIFRYPLDARNLVLPLTWNEFWKVEIAGLQKILPHWVRLYFKAAKSNCADHWRYIGVLTILVLVYTFHSCVPLNINRAFFIHFFINLDFLLSCGFQTHLASCLILG